MASDKTRVFYFNNGSGGGVLSVIRNILRYRQSDKIENHVIYTINKAQINNFELPDLREAVTQQIFYYSPNWNFNYTCRKLAQLLPDDKAVLVANDWLELGMVTHIGLANPVIQILHGDYDYYYELAVKHSDWIDAFITVANVIGDNLGKRLNERVKNIRYMRFPVPDILPKDFRSTTALLQVIFVGRLTKEKGYDLLPSIDNELAQRQIKVQWHIVGDLKQGDTTCWPVDSSVQFYGHLPNHSVIQLMQRMDCLILPSLAEGMPVTLIEAMKVGLTCLVNDLTGGIRELVNNGETGFRVKENKVIVYADLLQKLHQQRWLLQKIGENARGKATTEFEPETNTQHYEELISQSIALKKEARKICRIYGSRLDQPLIPNFITLAIRTFLPRGNP